jgi:glycosyltransferase involved in cell wall biosynthesis
MKLLHVLTTLDVGGAEMHVLTQVRGQVARGHSVRVVYLKGEGRLAADFRAAGADDVRRIKLGPLFPLRLRAHARWCDIVHSHLLKADAVTAVSALVLGARRKLVSGKHNDERALLNSLVSHVHGVLGRIPARTIVLSDHVGRFVEQHGRVPRARQERIYYGLDPAPFAAAAADEALRLRARAELGLADGDVAFICIARFAPQKAHDVLLRALLRARQLVHESGRGQSGPRLRLVLVGDDPFGDGRTRAAALARELGLGAAPETPVLPSSDAALFLGIRRDIPALLAASDVFVMASRWEGLGLVFLEAMAARRPCLSTNVSAIPEVVIDGETGLLVPPDDPEALAQGMVRLASDPVLRARLGAAGENRVRERFGLDRMVDETLDLYRRIVACG